MRWPKLVNDLVAEVGTQAKLAALVGSTERRVRDWKTGEHAPSAEHESRLKDVCRRHNINWHAYEGVTGVYDLRKSYAENYSGGPVGLENISYPASSNVPTNLLGTLVNSPIGLSSSVLTMNHLWVSRFAQYGFDIITGKTNRTRPIVAQPPLNWVYLPDNRVPVSVGVFPESFLGSEEVNSTDIAEITMANSFGIPSRVPEEWKADIEATISDLRSGQVYIASVIGTSEDKDDDKALLRDFVLCAEHAAEVKPFGVELNFSCPEGYWREGHVSRNVEAAQNICREVKSALPHMHLFVKIGYFNSRNTLHSLFSGVKAYVDGITAINTISSHVYSAAMDNPSIFARPAGMEAGISGAAIRNCSLQTVRWLNDMRKNEKPDLVLLGVGGIASPSHAEEFMNAGADAVQLCTAANRDPLIGMRVRELLREIKNRAVSLRVASHEEDLLVEFSTRQQRDVFFLVAKASAALGCPFDQALQLARNAQGKTRHPLSYEEIEQLLRGNKSTVLTRPGPT